MRRIDAEAEVPILWPPHKRPWCWERLKAGGEGGSRGRDDWMASSTQWTWVWARSGSWWWTGKPGVLQSMGLQRVPQDWATQQQQGGGRLSNSIIRMMMESWGNASLCYLGSLAGVLVCLFHFGLTFILTLVWVPVLQEFAVPSFDVKKTIFLSS